MSTKHNDDTQSAQPPNSTTEKLMTLPWIKQIRQTDRPDSTHVIDCGVGAVSLDDEIAALQAHDVTDITISQSGGYGQRLFVTIP